MKVFPKKKLNWACNVSRFNDLPCTFSSPSLRPYFPPRRMAGVGAHDSQPHGGGGPHHHGPLHPEKQISMQSLNYDEPWNGIRRARLRRLTPSLEKRLYAFRFVLDVLVGYVIGMLAVATHTPIQLLASPSPSPSPES